MVIENGRTMHWQGVFPDKQNQITINFFIEFTGMCVTTEYFHQVSEDQRSVYISPSCAWISDLGEPVFTIG